MDIGFNKHHKYRKKYYLYSMLYALFHVFCFASIAQRGDRTETWTRLKYWPLHQHYPERERNMFKLFLFWLCAVSWFYNSLMRYYWWKLQLKINKTPQNKSNLCLAMWGLYINPVLGIGVNIWACYGILIIAAYIKIGIIVIKKNGIFKFKLKI